VCTNFYGELKRVIVGDASADLEPMSGSLIDLRFLWIRLSCIGCASITDGH
jgi:hypothetical protein